MSGPGKDYASFVLTKSRERGVPTFYCWNDHWFDVTQDQDNYPSLFVSTIGIGRTVTPYQEALTKVTRCRPNENGILRLLTAALSECIDFMNTKNTLPLWWRKPEPDEGCSFIGWPNGWPINEDLNMTSELATMIVIPCSQINESPLEFEAAVLQFIDMATEYNRLRMRGGDWRIPFVYGLAADVDKKAYVITEPNLGRLIDGEIVVNVADDLLSKLHRDGFYRRFFTSREIPNDGFTFGPHTWKSNVIPTYHYYLDTLSLPNSDVPVDVFSSGKPRNPMLPGTYDPMIDPTLLRLLGSPVGVDQLAYEVVFGFKAFEGYDVQTRDPPPDVIDKILKYRTHIITRKKSMLKISNDVNRPASHREYAKAIHFLLDRLYAINESGSLQDLLPIGKTFKDYDGELRRSRG